MTKQHFRRTPLAALGGLVTLLLMASAAHATDASVPPVKVDGNPKCADYGLTAIAKFDPVNSGTKNGVTLTKHHTYYVDWTSTVPVDWVIVKGGPNANIYKYPADKFGDVWLRAPMNGSKPYGLSHVEFCGDGANEPKPKPGITVEKSGPAAAYVGDQVTYTFNVTNTGGVKLTGVTVKDDRCAPLVKAGGDSSFDPGDVWAYTCTTTITDAMGDELVNTVEACGNYGDTEKCDTDTHTTKIPKPAILLDKTGAATAAAGSTFTYSFKATNVGNVTLTDVVLSDDRCQSTLSRVEPNLADQEFDKGDAWFYACTVVAPAGPAQVDNVAKVCGDFDAEGVEPMTVCDDDPHTFTVPPPDELPGISIVKDGPSTRYVGQQATFTYKVTNAGNVKLSEPDVSDDKCSPVTKVTNDNSFDPGDVWNYTCTTTITAAMGDELVNIGTACAKYSGNEVCDDDDHKTKIPKPAILLDKTGADTAAAGSTFTYFFKATNIGNVTLTNVEPTDDRCQSTLTRVEPNVADPTFDKGDEWFYTCTVVAPAGPVQVDNVAKVCGDFDAEGVDPMTVCDDDSHTFTVPPPGTPPGTPPGDSPPPNSTPNVVPPPSGDVLPEAIASGRASLRGPSGCVKQAFQARVNGRSIASVTFFVDGRRVKQVNAQRASYSLTVLPRTYGFGRHKIVARVRFTAASETKGRSIPLTFRRCAQGATAPRFTG